MSNQSDCFFTQASRDIVSDPGVVDLGDGEADIDSGADTDSETGAEAEAEAGGDLMMPLEISSQLRNNNKRQYNKPWKEGSEEAEKAPLPICLWPRANRADDLCLDVDGILVLVYGANDLELILLLTTYFLAPAWFVYQHW